MGGGGGSVTAYVRAADEYDATRERQPKRKADPYAGPLFETRETKEKA